jgi:hypothetical protein
MELPTRLTLGVDVELTQVMQGAALIRGPVALMAAPVGMSAWMQTGGPGWSMTRAAASALTGISSTRMIFMKEVVRSADATTVTVRVALFTTTCGVF